MARRPEVRPAKEVLSREELRELRSRLAVMSVTGLRDFYQTAHFRCQLQDNAVPGARAAGAGAGVEGVATSAPLWRILATGGLEKKIRESA